MANMASNESSVIFTEGSSFDEKVMFFKEFSEIFNCEDYSEEVEEDKFDYQINFESKWNLPKDELIELLKKHSFVKEIKGCCSEGHYYASYSFEQGGAYRIYHV